MTTLNLLTKDGFKSINHITNISIYDNNFKLKKIDYINRFENFYFPCYQLSLSTGITFTCRSDQRFKGLIFERNEIKTDLDVNLISDFDVGDYLYTPFPEIDLFDRDFNFKYLEVFNTLNDDFYNKDSKFKDKILEVTDKDFNSSVCINIDKDFYKFLSICLVRGKLNTLNNYISFKFNKSNDLHLRSKVDLINFFNTQNLNFEITEYNNYYYVNYSDTTLLSYIEKLKQEQYNDISELFNNEFQELFILYLFTITKNTYYLSYNSYLFFKKLAYNNNLVLVVDKNPINSNHNYSLKSRLVVNDEENTYKSMPEIIYLEFGYLTKITNLTSVNLKGDALLLPEYLLVC